MAAPSAQEPSGPDETSARRPDGPDGDPWQDEAAGWRSDPMTAAEREAWLDHGGGGRGTAKPRAVVMTRLRHGLLPALPRPVWVVLGGDLVSAADSGLKLPCLFIYAHRVRGLSYGTAGLVVATIPLASLACNPAGGAAADPWTPPRALM